MSLNKENINGDFKKGFKVVYGTVRVILHLGLFGIPLFYANYINPDLTLKDASLWGQFFILEIFGFLTILFSILLFHFFHAVETRYFKGSYKMAYILLKYVFPYSKMNLSGITYEDVCMGYEEILKIGNNYHGIKESDSDLNENL